MPFKHACFISYSSGQHGLAERMINELSQALASELELWLRLGVYVDRERLKGGDFFETALAQALCESVCMIVAYIPRYFDTEYPFCAREYKAMEKLEAERLHALGNQEDSTQGLIIPIVFRGLHTLPHDLKKRHHYIFDTFSGGGPSISKHHRHAQDIKEIAHRIYDHYQRLSALQRDPCDGCLQCRLPSEEEIFPWLKTVQGSGPPPFPGR